MKFEPVSQDLKVAYLGGGSRGWANIFMRDLALHPLLSGEVRLYDIDFESAKINERFGNWIGTLKNAASVWRYKAVETIAEALKGADIVIASVQPGSLEAMRADLEIPQKYGIFQSVGDTVGPAGIMRGFRSVNIYKYFAQQVAENCPDAWVINYTNPMTVCTRTLTKVVPQLKVFGCCHEVFGTQAFLARLVADEFEVPPPERHEIKVNVLGINHFTWIDRATWQGCDLLALVRNKIENDGCMRPYSKSEVLNWNDYFHHDYQVTYSLFQKFGILPAAGDRHLAEFVPGYLSTEDECYRWGFSLTPIQYRYDRWNSRSQKRLDYLAGKEKFNLVHSCEEGDRQIQAIVGLGDFFTNCNMENKGQISNLPLNSVVETNAYFSHDCVRPVAAGELPPGVRIMVLRHVQNQELTIEAALQKDIDLGFQAFWNDPLFHIPIDKAWKMYKEMLHATAEWLPGWRIDSRSNLK